jgi:uroporphyrinogen-III decarboxylase
MDAKERVLTACAFEQPDRIPTFDSFWEYPDLWRKRLGEPEGLTDIAIWIPEEAPFPTRARFLKEQAGWIYEVDSYGRTVRRRRDAYFCETLEVPIPLGTDIDRVQFDPPELEERYLMGRTPAAVDMALRRDKERHCVFAKTGGPYLRTTYVRGEQQFLMDIAGDPPLARALADKMAAHLAAVGVEELRRWSLCDTGIFIYDDMAHNLGPMFSPRSFETIFLPAYRRMIRAYKEAGAHYVFLHSDGDIRPLLDMLVDAGIQGINPLERRANMDIAKMRELYPSLVLIGGMDNTDTLINGPTERVVSETREIIDLGRHGGVVIGTHSVSPEIPLEHFVAYRETCLTDGRFV